MKKRLAILLAVVFFAITSPALAGVLQPVLAGNWEIEFDWGCDGIPSMAVWYLSGDGTFVSSSGSTGTWGQTGRAVTVVYETGCLPVYTGKLGSLKKMSGTMECTDGSENSGCFTAKKMTVSVEDMVQGEEEDDSP